MVVELPMDGLIQATFVNCGKGRASCPGGTWLRLKIVAGQVMADIGDVATSSNRSRASSR